MNNTESSLIRYENVHIQFKDTALLHNLTFRVSRGDKILLYGESGIGKTTIFRLLLGFEPLQKGTISFNDRPLTAPVIWDMRHRIAYVSQDLDIGSGEVLTMLRRVLSFKANQHVDLQDSKLQKLLDLLRLSNRILKDEYETISGGEKQRIAILIALLLKRDIFLLDEITSSLDTDLKNTVIQYFTQNKEWTVLTISHDNAWLDVPGIKVIKLGRHHANS